MMTKTQEKQLKEGNILLSMDFRGFGTSLAGSIALSWSETGYFSCRICGRQGGYSYHDCVKNRKREIRRGCGHALPFQGIPPGIHLFPLRSLLCTPFNSTIFLGPSLHSWACWAHFTSKAQQLCWTPQESEPLCILSEPGQNWAVEEPSPHQWGLGWQI